MRTFWRNLLPPYSAYKNESSVEWSIRNTRTGYKTNPLALLTLLTWIWRQEVPPKRCYITTKQHRVTSQSQALPQEPQISHAPTIFTLRPRKVVRRRQGADSGPRVQAYCAKIRLLRVITNVYKCLQRYLIWEGSNVSLFTRYTVQHVTSGTDFGKHCLKLLNWAETALTPRTARLETLQTNSYLPTEATL
jgi:hypothetical protein